MLRAQQRRRLMAGAIATAALFTQSAVTIAEQSARSDENMRVGVTDISHRVYDLHMLSLWICVAIGVVVFGVMFYSIFAHRKSKGAVASHFHESTKLEIAWTVVPFIILLFMAVPATKVLTDIYNADDAALDVRITGYQWKWKYSYPKEGVEFFSSLRTPRDEINNLAPKGENYLLDVDEPLVIPAGQKVRFLVTAADVIHSWWMPDFSVKRDAIPGFVNETWAMVPEPGVYRGQCTELCGKDHGFMPIVVRVLPQDEFDSWIATRKEAAVKERELMAQIFSMEQSMERGKGVYENACASCHQPNGEGIPGAFPALKGSALAMGPMEGHLDIVVHGKAGTSMAAFGAQLSEVDMAAVITYERNAWGNNVGDILQPIDVANFKKGK